MFCLWYFQDLYWQTLMILSFNTGCNIFLIQSTSCKVITCGDKPNKPRDCVPQVTMCGCLWQRTACKVEAFRCWLFFSVRCSSEGKIWLRADVCFYFISIFGLSGKEADLQLRCVLFVALLQSWHCFISGLKSTAGWTDSFMCCAQLHTVFSFALSV